MARFGWQAVCELEDILPDTGVCASVDGRQIALFRVDGAVHAIDNCDPASGAHVLSRGIVGDLGGELVVASPLYKHHYSLTTGRCLEEPAYAVRTHPCRLLDGKVWLRSTAAVRDPAARAAAGSAAGAACATGAAGAATPKRRLVVIGNGMAGMRTVEELLAMAPDLYDIEIFGAEPFANYNRILLSPVLSGEKRAEEIQLHPLDWYAERSIRLHLGDAVADIDRVRRRVRSQSGRSVTYDRLLIATGSNPIVLPIPGHDLPGVVSFRDLQDVDAMLRAAREHGRAAVIGGGLLGLEAAHGLSSQGMEVTVVHRTESLMERQLDAVAAGLLQRSLEKRGIEFKLAANTEAILGDSRVTALRLADGSVLPTDLVVMAVGIRPNIALAAQAGLRCERGILVDDTLLTFDPSIYAVGECVQHREATYGLVAPLWEQARVCATHLAELGVSRYRGSLTATNLKVTGIQVFSAGNWRASPRSESLILHDTQLGIYKHLILENDRVQGAVLYGDTRDGPWYAELMGQERPIGPMREQLLFGRDFAEPPA
ncbi:MAG TPA: nitrite reductase small subunit NirD [Steroidobacteraceae bacterium]|nr:nitrite reductase small subunit NirD [Steroidobacteraceae bacterium]